jgi:exonuclease SbcD
VKLAMLHFVSQRGIIRAADLMSLAGFEAAQRYTDRIARLIDSLCEDFSDDCVNLIAAHGFVLGGETGGGERAAHLIEEYAISTHAFPPTAAYVALGHLHRPQSLAGATSLRYCGSPLQLDFGETAQDKQVNLVEVLPGVPARVDPLPVTSGRALHTIAGDLDQLAEQALDLPSDCWVRAIARTERRAGLAEEVRELIGDRVVDVILAGVESDSSPSDRSSRRGRPPRDLFIEFLAERGVEDERLLALFDQLLDRASSPTGTGAS